MGRPIKRKFFGVDNTADSASYGSGAGGEGISSFTYTNRGVNYSQGLTATAAVSPIGGTRAVIVPAVSTANGRVNSVSISTAGDGYTTAPALTFTKPANVAVTGTNAAFWQDAANLRLSSTTGLYVGMFSNVAGAGTSMITNIYTDGNIRANVTYGNVSNGTPINFYDAGASLNITAVLASVITTANTIQANAWITGGTIGKQADIVSQRSSRRYRVTNADGTAVTRLVPTGVNGVNSPTVAQVISAGGPTAAGEMTLLATDSDGGVYLVGKLDSRTALLFPAAIGGSAGTQFAANAHVTWTSTGAAVEDTVVKLATND
jgi:hypothetical protein